MNILILSITAENSFLINNHNENVKGVLLCEERLMQEQDTKKSTQRCEIFLLYQFG